MKNLLSVIVPVYNTERTLERTVKSIIEQTWDNIEIILVDDESPDNAGSLCDRLAIENTNVKVIHKPNEGLGFARNAGLNVAQGRYVAFLDSDDWVMPNTYEKCINALITNNAEACYYGRKVFQKDGSYLYATQIPSKLLFYGEEIVAEFAFKYFGDWTTHPDDVFIRESACCALYDRELILANNILFKSERRVLSEDLFFNLDICRVASGVVIIPEYLYNQGFNPTSLTRKRDTTRFLRSITMYNELIKYTVNFPEIEDVEMRVKYRIISLIRGLIRDEVYSSSSNREAYIAIEEMIHNPSIIKIFDNFDYELIDKKTSLFINWVLKGRTFNLLLLYRFKSLINRLQDA